MKKLIFVIITVILILPLSRALAQNGTFPVQNEAATSSVAPAEPRAIPNPAPGAATPRAETPASAPAPANPIPTAPTPADQPTPSQQIESPIAEASPNPNSNAGLLAVLISVALALTAYGIYKIKAKSNVRKNDKDKKEGRSCFDIKKLMEKKLEELTDLRGQLESKAKEKSLEMLRDAVQGTPAAELLSAIERAEKEYGRMKMLYYECMAEVSRKSRVFIVHGWEGYPEEGWFP